jgi:ATP-dependent RNA helicase DeaD
MVDRVALTIEVGVSGFLEWQMMPAVAAGLERLGWQAGDPEVRDAVPAALRGTNVVAVLPPSPAWAVPLVGGLVGQPDKSGTVLMLAGPALLDEWVTAVGALIEGTPLLVDVLRPGASSRPLAPTPDIVIATPATAFAFHAQSALRPEQFRAIVFVWPESWNADEAVSAILQDCPRDAQRLMITSRSDQTSAADGVVERYARKAVVVQSPRPAIDTKPPAPVRSVPASWNGRAAALAAIADRITGDPVTIWTADTRDQSLIRRAFGSLPASWRFAARDVPRGGETVCYDLPSEGQLAALRQAGPVTLLMAPGTEAYVESIAPSRQPLQATSPLRAVIDRDESIRSDIAGRIAAGADAGALYALGPLFDRHDPQLVAAALFSMWQRTRDSSAGSGGGSAPSQPPTVTAATSAASGVAKLWIGAGKKDEATVGDFVAILVREAKMDRTQIGRIDLRDTFALVEVPAADAEAIAQRLVGVTIRKRKLSARVDRGRGGGR